MTRLHLRCTLSALLAMATGVLQAQALPLPAQDHAHEGGRASMPVAASPIAVAIDAATLERLAPRQPVQAIAHGKPLDCEGFPLADVLRASNAMPAEPLRGSNGLDRYVLVSARDGYRALFSLAELDASLGADTVLLVDRCDGKPLGDDEGPLRLIAPTESRPARWVRQIDAITVIVAP